MASLGVFLLLYGLVSVIVVQANFDTSVPVPNGHLIGVERVNNIGLMEEKRNYMTVSIGSMIVGAIFTAVGWRKAKA